MAVLRDLVLEVMIAERVHAALQSSGMTQRDLGHHIGLTVDMMSDRAVGRTRWSIVELYAVGKTLGVDPKTFLP